MEAHESLRLAVRGVVRAHHPSGATVALGLDEAIPRRELAGVGDYDLRR